MSDAHPLPECTLSREVLAVPSSVGLLRDLAAVQLAKWGAGTELIDDVTLVVSELATNGVAACPRGLLGFEMYVVPGALVVEVRDGAATQPRRRAAAVDDTTGRGLEIVDYLVERRGVRHPPGGGKTVWALFRADLPQTPAP